MRWPTAHAQRRLLPADEKEQEGHTQFKSTDCVFTIRLRAVPNNFDFLLTIDTPREWQASQ